MRQALDESVRAYAQAEGVPGQARFEPYLALNRLALDALTPWTSDTARDAALDLAQRCGEAAGEAFRRDGQFFSAVMQPEALLVALRLDGTLARPGDAGEAPFEQAAAAYGDALSNLACKPKEIDSVVSQMALMSRFHDALAVVEATTSPDVAAAHRRVADRLIALAERLQPGACRRDDRPAEPAVSAPAPPKAAPKKATRAVRKPAARRAR